MITIKNSRIAKILKVDGIVLYPFILFAKKDPGTVLMKHEMIHVEQIKQSGLFKFYFSYLLQYVQFRFKGLDHNHAYRFISFEKEAYEKENC
jgi:hypothetical protein